MVDNKKNFEPFDFYHTSMGFSLCTNSDEKLLKLSDYGITEHEINIYRRLIEQRREEAANRHKIYEHRSNFFKVLVVLFLIYVFFFIVGYFNDFMREYEILFDSFCGPVYIGLIWVLYKYAYPFLVFVINSTQEKIEESYKYPNNGHPDGYDPRIEKYFNDLLWKLKDHPNHWWN